MKGDPRLRVLFYSDCSFFAGCENMLANMLNSPDVSGEFDVFFAYRYGANYAAGMADRVRPETRTSPLRIPTLEANLEAMERNGLGWLVWLMRYTGSLLVLKYSFALYAVAVLFFLMKRLKPDILHINNGGYPAAYSCISAVFAARLAGVQKVIFVVNNTPVPYTYFSRRLEKPIDGFLGRNVSVFVTASEYAGARLREVFKALPAEKFLVIPNGIAPRPMKESGESVLARLGIPAGTTILGNVAVFEPRKGHKYLLQAMALVRDKLSDFSKVVLLIEGFGAEKPRLEKFAADLGLGDNVRFLSQEANIFDLMRIFDVFILPSISYEDFPNVILEAMSLGKPVIGTRVAGIPEQVLDGETGLVVAPADAGALAGAILRLLNNVRERGEMGRNGLERFNARFVCEKPIAIYAALYRKLVPGERR